jgi:hypothetical protein
MMGPRSDSTPMSICLAEAFRITTVPKQCLIARPLTARMYHTTVGITKSDGWNHSRTGYESTTHVSALMLAFPHLCEPHV